MCIRFSSLNSNHVLPCFFIPACQLIDTARVTPPGDILFTRSPGRSCGNAFSQPWASRLWTGASRYHLQLVICIPVPKSDFRIALRRETDVTDKKTKKCYLLFSHDRGKPVRCASTESVHCAKPVDGKILSIRSRVSIRFSTYPKCLPLYVLHSLYSIMVYGRSHSTASNSNRSRLLKPPGNPIFNSCEICTTWPN